MKLWAVHFMSENSVHYYESFRSEKEPTEKQLKRWWKKSDYGEKWDYINIREIWEIDPNSSILK